MNHFPPHIVQSDQWGRFKSSQGTPAHRIGKLQVTLHRIPFTPWSVGYCPKPQPKDINEEALVSFGKKHRLTHVMIDVPNGEAYSPPAHVPHTQVTPQFAPATFVIDLTKSEADLSAGLHQKTRYNIKVAQKHGVEIVRSKSPDTFLALLEETGKRQQFFNHPASYYSTLYDQLSGAGECIILEAQYKGDTLAAFMLLRFGDTLYYPYGGTTPEHRQVMAPTLLMWECILLGKELGCTVFDMWGALEHPDPTHPWYGFHRFKAGFGPTLVTFPPSYDLIINKPAYTCFKAANALRWKTIRLIRR